MDLLKDKNDLEDIRKLAEEFIFNDLHEHGYIAQVYYDISNIPAWYFFGATDHEFVERVYGVVLNRRPSFAEISNVKANLAAGVLSRAQYLMDVVNSAESMAMTSRATVHINDLASAELAWQKALASADLTKLESGLKAYVGRGRQKHRDPKMQGISAEHLTLIASELQSLREGLNDVLRTNSQNSERKTSLIRSRRPKFELRYRQEELELIKQRILTELDRRYRGSEEALKTQLEFYLPHIHEIRELGTVIDVGCGRGTFLDIMRAHGVDAIGLELNADQVEECLRKNLDVRLADALEFLRRSEDDAYGAITLFHVIEHLHFDALVAILIEAYRVVAAGGIVLIETPNAENLYVSTFMFHVDPTHVKPITYQYISTILEVVGFQCERLPVSASLHNNVGGETGNEHLNYLLSVSSNLSVVARKARRDS